ncbi:MAG: NAD(P)-binding protein, partial [Deltaproteobacteria bacterium]|nr:NAD(P)-binding protein [Kofleriaceae bacterium]
MDVLIIGGGAAAIAAAHRLIEGGATVELLEAGPALGGNCAAVDVPTAGGGTVTIDAGVSDFNRRTFVRVDAMVRELGLAVRAIDETASTMFPDGTLAWTTRGGTLRVPGAPGAAERVVDDIARFRREAPT